MNHSIDIGAGVIDNDYRGEIIPCLINNGHTPFIVKRFDRIAQLIVIPYNNLPIQESETLTTTHRNKGGFGSTTIQPQNNEIEENSEDQQQFNEHPSMQTNEAIEKETAIPSKMCSPDVNTTNLTPTLSKAATKETRYTNLTLEIDDPLVNKILTQNQNSVDNSDTHDERSPNQLPSTEVVKSKWTKILKGHTLITILLPWSSSYCKGSILKYNNEFIFKEKSSQINHIIPCQMVCNLLQNNKILLGHQHLITRPATDTPSHIIPPLRTVDKPLSSRSNTSRYTIDQLQKNFCFCNVTSFVKKLKSTATNFSISTMDREEILDLGETANIEKTARKNHTTPIPPLPGQMVHIYCVRVRNRNKWH